MSCLAIMGAMVTAGIKAAKPDGALGAVAVFGLVAAVLASVYRYIVRLAYFYDARADVFELLEGGRKPNIAGSSGMTVDACVQLLRLISPDAVEYSGNADALKKAADAWMQGKK